MMGTTKKENKGMEDNVLLEKMKKGEEQAFTLLYHRYFNMLYELALRYLKDRDMAQDAVQQTFVKLWENRRDIKVKGKLSNYLYTMTKNYILNQIRHNNTVVAHHYEMAQGQNKLVESIARQIEKKETLDAFYKALGELPERHREICLLKMKGDMTNEQIAKTLNVSTSTVKLNFKQSKDLLKLYLGEGCFFITLLLSSRCL